MYKKVLCYGTGTPDNRSLGGGGGGNSYIRVLPINFSFEMNCSHGLHTPTRISIRRRPR